MPSKYFYCLLLPLLVSSVKVSSQNIPDLNATGPGGSVTPINEIPVSNLYFTPSSIRTYIPKVPISNAANINVGSSPSEVQIATDYKDGLGRTIQSVKHYTSTGTRPHLVMPVSTRFKNYDISYLPFPSGTAAFDYNMLVNQYDYTTTVYAAEGYTGYSMSRNISNAQQRAVKTMTPGRSQVGQNRGVIVKQISNAANEIKIWEPDIDGKPVLLGSYAAGALFGEQVYDTTGILTTSYTDNEGKLICRIVKQYDQNVGGGAVTTISGTTYYVYDVMDRLICIMPPKATAASASSVSATVFDNLCFRYRYDDKGRLSAQRFPGEEDYTEQVYDLKDRAVMRRTANEKAAGQWEVTFYDPQGRLKATSLYANNSSRSYWQNLLDAGSGSSNPADLLYYLASSQGEAAYPAENAVSGNTMMAYTYYDDYTLSDPGSFLWDACNNALVFTGETLSTLGAETPVRGEHQHGRTTGTKVRILTAPGADASKTGQWRSSATFYDGKGRVIYTASRDLYQNNTIHAHYTGMQYDFAGRIIFSKHVMQNMNGNTTMHKEWFHNEFDWTTGKATKSWHKTDSGTWVIQSSYNYDELGRVKREMLGNFGEIRDYTYNIRGQLTGINDYYTRTGDRQGESRSFGESLCYDHGFTVPRYDGKISGMLWRGAGSSLVNAYGYDYDYSGRLTGAEYRRYEPPSGSYFAYAWRKDLADYTVSNLSYDRDGNIKSMDQRSVQPGVGLVNMDQLVYSYEDSEQSNRLNKVVDNAAFSGLGDFNNTNSSNSDYDYDPNGNLALDNNKGIASVTYTHFNKPQTISFSNGKSIAYSYDAAGSKVQERIIDGSTITETDYVGNYVYENNVLQYIITKEGRSIYDNSEHRFTEEYFVKDHLNNVRSVVEVYVPPVLEYFATYEIASANLEGMFFDHMDEVRDDRPGGTPGNNQAGNLNGSDTSRRIGTSMLLRVMAGDRIEMNVNNFYERYEQQNDNPIGPEDMLASIINTLRGGNGGFVGSESHDIKTVTDAFTVDNYSVFDQILNNNVDINKPRAYLNYVMFDENMMIVPNMSGAFQANGEGTWTQIGTTTPLEFPVNGYIAVYLSNTSQNIAVDELGNVYFDQLVIRFSRGKLKEEAHYYPHGLPIANMGSTANGYMENRRKYQGNEYITDIGLNWMDFHARQYDPQIGGFLGVDPLATVRGQEIFSPYAAMGNNPAMAIDPLGTYFTYETPGLATALKNLQAENERKIQQYNEELGSLDLFSGNSEIQNRAEALKALIGMHEAFRDQLKAMDESPAEFHLSNDIPQNGAAGSTFYNSKEGRVQFNFGGDNPWIATLAHELRHGYGYLSGEIIVSTYDPNEFYDMMDEVVANQTGLLFTSTPNKAINGTYGLGDFEPATKSGGAYPQLAGKQEQLSISTPIPIFQKYYEDRLINSYLKQNGNPNATVEDAINFINSRVKNGPPRYMWGDLLKK